MQGRMVKVRTERSTPSGGSENVICFGEFDQVTGTWLERVHAGIQLIYLDPPFFTGRQFKRRVSAEEETIDVLTYGDIWDNMEAYLAMIRRALVRAHTLLAPGGSIFVHVDFRTSAHIRLLLDEIFGYKSFVNEIIWVYESGGRSRKHFSRKHDTIFFYAKSKAYFFDLSTIPSGTRGENKENHMKRETDSSGRTFRTIRSHGKEYRYYDDEPVYPSDVWTDISHLQQRDPERTGYNTQKPIKLLKRIIGSASREGDLVADFFAGSGTTGVAAAQLGRRFYLGDMSRQAVMMMDTRLLKEKDAYCIEEETHLDSASLEVEIQKTANDITVRLTSFVLPNDDPETKLTGLKAIDHWSAGFLEGDTYIRLCTSFRPNHLLSFATSQADRKDLAVMIWDYLGNRRCFRLAEIGE